MSTLRFAQQHSTVRSHGGETSQASTVRPDLELVACAHGSDERMERARNGHVCCLQRGDVVGKVPLVNSLAHALNAADSLTLARLLASDRVQSLLTLLGSA